MCGRPPPPCGASFSPILRSCRSSFTWSSSPVRVIRLNVSCIRLRGGNDSLPKRIAHELRSPIYLRHVVRRIVQTKEKVCVTVENSRGKRTELQGRYAIVTSPATLTAEILFSPALPEAQRDAFAQLRYGRATKTLCELDRHPWRREKRPRACATDIELGAIWDGSEEQRGR